MVELFEVRKWKWKFGVGRIVERREGMWGINRQGQRCLFINIVVEIAKVVVEIVAFQVSLDRAEKLNPIIQTGWLNSRQPKGTKKQCPLENFQLSIDTTNTQNHSHKGSIIREQQWKKKKKTKSSWHTPTTGASPQKRTTTNNKESHPQPPSSPPHLASNSSQDPGSQTLVQLHPAPSSSCSTATPGPFALPRQTQVGDCGGAFEGHRFAESEALWCESSLHSVAWE